MKWPCVTTILEAEVKQWLRNYGIVVWLDKDGTYTPYVDSLADRHAQQDFFAPVIPFRGSYLDLLFALEPYGDKLDPEPLLIHMPGHTEQTITKTPLLELYRAGTRYRRALDTLVREAATGKLPPDSIETYVSQQLSDLSEADRWLSSTLTAPADDIDHYLAGLSSEWVLEAFAVGIDTQRNELHRQLAMAADGEGVFKFLRGGYGCGKTFMSRLAILDAQAQGFATSFVVVSDNDLHFYKFDDVYRKVVQELGTSACPRGALSDIIDRWIARVEDGLIASGQDEDSDDFDTNVKERMEEDLASMTGGKAPEDMARVLRAIFELKQQGNIAEASALISWLSGSENVAASAKKAASIKGDIGSREALDYLQGILEIVKAAGYKGLVIVIDEAETILRMRRDIRGKSLNGIRQICDAADRYRGLLWLFTGTPEFFDTQRGVAGLSPLHDRVAFKSMGGFSNPKQPQMELKPFDANRLKEVAAKLRELYPAQARTQVASKVTNDFVERLVAEVTTGFRGDVGVVPRQFLRQFVDVLDLTDDNPDFDPMTAAGFEPKALTEAEQHLQAGRPLYEAEPEDQEGYAAVEF